MIYPMLISKKAKDAWIKRILIWLLVESSILVGFLIYTIIFKIYKNFLIVISFLMAVIFLTILAFFLNYIRTPAEIRTINDRGFEYLTVLGKRRVILWDQIIDIEKYRKFDDVFIIYRINTGKEGIDIIYEQGIKIKEAWEKWKNQNRENDVGRVVNGGDANC